MTHAHVIILKDLNTTSWFIHPHISCQSHRDMPRRIHGVCPFYDICPTKRPPAVPLVSAVVVVTLPVWLWACPDESYDNHNTQSVDVPLNQAEKWFTESNSAWTVLYLLLVLWENVLVVDAHHCPLVVNKSHDFHVTHWNGPLHQRVVVLS